MSERYEVTYDDHNGTLQTAIVYARGLNLREIAERFEEQNRYANVVDVRELD